MLTMEVEQHQTSTPTDTTSTPNSSFQNENLLQDKVSNSSNDKTETSEKLVLESKVPNSPSTFPSGMVNEEQKPSSPLSMPTLPTTTTTTRPQKSISLQKEQQKFIQGVIRGLKRHPQASPFLLPVDPIALNIPNYTSVILNPSDLQSIERKMDSYPLNEFSLSSYTPELFEADVRLIFSNCLLFNGPENPITKMSFLLEKYFNNTMAKMPLTEKVTASMSSAYSSSSSSSLSHTINSPKRVKRPPTNSSKLSKGPVRKALTPEMQFCSQILKELTKKANLVISWPFLDPVDPVKLNIPDYFTIIKQPMDLNKIRSKLLETKEYSSSDEFEADVRLIISNCLLYNGIESDVATMCRGFERLFDDLWATKPSVFPLPPPAPIKRQQPQQFSGSFGSTNDSDSQRIFELNNKIQVLQAELNGLLMRSAGIVSPSGHLSPSGSHSSIPSSSSHTSTAPKRVRKKPAPRSFSPSTSNRPVSEEQFLSTPMNFEEKSLLSQQVNELDPDRLGRVVEIIQSGMSLEAQGDSDVIELDIESLPVRTLRELQRFVLGATKGINDFSQMLASNGRTAADSLSEKKTTPLPNSKSTSSTTNNNTRPAGMISSDDEKDDDAEEDSDEDSDEE